MCQLSEYVESQLSEVNLALHTIALKPHIYYQAASLCELYYHIPVPISRDYFLFPQLPFAQSLVQKFLCSLQLMW